MRERSVLTPQIMLATSMQAQPGVYAVLLGSGVSSSAGIPTGWGVVGELVARVAAAANPADPEAARDVADDPEAWWSTHGQGELGYSALLASLAPSAATRQGLLAGFFEQSDEDREMGRKEPTPAHRSLAKLVERGSVRVIVTTNFDRLMERALEEVGVSPQVVASPAAIDGMTPLAHATATVIKLHGDYADLGMRNTLEELESYPPQLEQVIDQVFRDFGLIVAGWSAEWDAGLRSRLEGQASRRYPLYWDGRSARADAAARLIRLRQGHIIEEDAEGLFASLLASVEALDLLAEPPLATALAIVSLKRFLPDPTRRIDLHDLLMGSVNRLAEDVLGQPTHVDALSTAVLDDVYEELLTATTPLLSLLVEGVRHDAGLIHRDLWVEVMRRLLSLRGQPDGPFQDALLSARHYPALLALHAMGAVAIRYQRDSLLLDLAEGAWWRDLHGSRTLLPTAQVLHMQKVLDHAGCLPRWGDSRWYYPESHLLRADLRDVLRPVLASDDDYRDAMDSLEYRLGMVQETQQDVPGAYRAAPGEFAGEGQWTYDDGLRAEVAFRSVAEQAPDDWPWWKLVGGAEYMDAHLLAYRETLSGYRRYG